VARPGVVVNLAWEQGRPTAASLRALGPGAAVTHRLRFGARTLEVELPADGSVVELASDAIRALVGGH
jgi:hypothetical protein